MAGLFYPTNRPFDPSKNIVDGMAQDVRDINKQLGYIRTVEARLRGKKPGEDSKFD